MVVGTGSRFPHSQFLQEGFQAPLGRDAHQIGIAPAKRTPLLHRNLNMQTGYLLEEGKDLSGYGSIFGGNDQAPGPTAPFFPEGIYRQQGRKLRPQATLSFPQDPGNLVLNTG